MKNLPLFLSAVLLLLHPAYGSNLEINGTYTQSEDWDVDTLSVTGNIVVALPDTEKIIIQPGTVVLFHGPFSVAAGNDNLIMDGNREQPILFTTADTAIRWGGIFFDSLIYRINQIPHVSYPPLPDDTLSISFCTFERCDNLFGVITLNNSACKGSRPMIISNCHFSNNNCLGTLFSQQDDLSDSIPIFISDCLFENNLKGAIYSYEYNLVLERNRFLNNVGSTGSSMAAAQGIGACNLWYCDCIVNDNEFKENTGNEYASAIYHSGHKDSSTIVVSRNIFTKNTGLPAVYLLESHATISGNVFKENISTTCVIGGATLYLNGTHQTTISANIFSDNIDECNSAGASSSGGASGGGIYINNASELMVSNNLFIGNSAFRGGALFCTSTDSAVFINNTFSGNTGRLGPAVYDEYPRGDHRYINNCIYGNNVFRTDDSVVYQVFLHRPVDAGFINCLLPPGDSVYLSEHCTDCIFNTPEFTDTTENDYSLKEGSPGIDAGADEFMGFLIEATDLAGNPRVFNDIIDIGAYEFHEPEPVRPLTIHTSNRLQKKMYRLSFFGTPGAGGRAFTLSGAVVKQTSRKTRKYRGAVLIRK